jgi:hypothetical protein
MTFLYHVTSPGDNSRMSALFDTFILTLALPSFTIFSTETSKNGGTGHFENHLFFFKKLFFAAVKLISHYSTGVLPEYF